MVNFLFGYLVDDHNSMSDVDSLWRPSIEDIQPESSSSDGESEEESELDLLLSKLWRGILPTPTELKSLIEQATVCFKKEPNILRIPPPISVVGDIHGQFYDLVEVFRIAGFPPYSRFLFLGDYVDRGQHSVQVISLLLCLKVKFQEHFFLIRGNHESMNTTSYYGFRQELLRKYRSEIVYSLFAELFDSMPIAAVIGDSVFCVHGGLAEGAMTLDEISKINRFAEIPASGPLCDLLWADPMQGDGDFGPSKRRAGRTWGSRITKRFLERNKLSMIVRAHEVVQNGYEYSHERKVLTVFSAPNYGSFMTNKGAILIIDENMGHTTVAFQQAPPQETVTSALSHFVY